jgi:TetR/AcrR family transcriptional regulator
MVACNCREDEYDARTLRSSSAKLAKPRAAKPKSGKPPESSRARVLDGAADEFAAAGFAGARIERIARRTRLNVRMIYYHFGSKRGLYRGVLEMIYEQMSAILDALPPSAENRALEALSRYFDLLAEQPRFADVLVREMLDGARHLKTLSRERPELFRNIHYHARQIIEAGVAAGELGDYDPAMAVMSVTSIICFFTAARHSHALFLDEDRAHPWKQHLMRLLVDGLRKRA